MKFPLKCSRVPCKGELKTYITTGHHSFYGDDAVLLVFECSEGHNMNFEIKASEGSLVRRWVNEGKVC